MPPNLSQRRQETVACQAVLLQQPTGRRRGRLVKQGDDQMLHRDLLILEPPSLPRGVVDQAREPLRDEYLPRRRPRTGNAGPASQLGL